MNSFCDCLGDANKCVLVGGWVGGEKVGEQVGMKFYDCQISTNHVSTWSLSSAQKSNWQNEEQFWNQCANLAQVKAACLVPESAQEALTVGFSRDSKFCTTKHMKCI